MESLSGECRVESVGWRVESERKVRKKDLYLQLKVQVLFAWSNMADCGKFTELALITD